MIRYLVILFLVTCISCRTSSDPDKAKKEHANPDSSFLDFNVLQDSICNYLNISTCKLIGEIETPKNIWLIIEGEISDPTYQDIGLYLFPKNKGEIPDSILRCRYSYPGKEYSFEGDFIFESKVFYGNCIAEYNNSIIWLQKEKKEAGWETDLFILTLTDFEIKSVTLDEEASLKKQILKSFEKGTCLEILGKDHFDEP